MTNEPCKTTVFKEFKFESAHRLDYLPNGHKCKQLHGHSYRLRVYVRGFVDPVTGWVIDFDDIKKACGPLVDQLDHRFLNDIEGMGISTSENICRWFWQRLHGRLPGLLKIELWETSTCGAVFEGNQQ